LPSLCTTCYRVGRVGRDFTEKTIAGEMNKFCQANAILTLREYSLDQRGSGNGDELKTLDKTIASSIDEVKDPAIKKTLLEKLQELEKGKRDLFF
ncbi:MAG: [FeFe] hydrogenase H-cluster radical SAM maturase HydG, partial [Deltaproteobacteria bacterium]